MQTTNPSNAGGLYNMDTKAIATLHDGRKINGRLTTAHAASSYGQPVFVDADGQAYNWGDITDISTAPALGRLGGLSTSKRKAAAARRNGKRGGRPRKSDR